MARIGLTETVQKKIAFMVFTTTDTHQQIADKFGVSRPTVSNIARKFNLQRHKSKPGGGNKIGSKQTKHDIDTVNWTYDDNLILQRIQRRQDNIQKEINRMVKAAINL